MSVLAPLTSTAGNHQITLRLQPEGLGVVDATVVVRANHVTVSLSTETPAARQALGAALPQLRHDLGQGGQQATVFMSGGDGRHRPGSDPSAQAGFAGPDEAQPEPIPPVPVGSGAASSSIDLRL